MFQAAKRLMNALGKTDRQSTGNGLTTWEKRRSLGKTRVIMEGALIAGGWFAIITLLLDCWALPDHRLFNFVLTKVIGALLFGFLISAAMYFALEKRYQKSLKGGRTSR